ncbi:FAD-dependent monooxygenase [Oscillatoria sp. FACHB-1407]|uniref:FAD-dependent monooxygenase n=1 Tax=Oscillatoria sp. FACHB-1407 TaxID=2692847 RepID=UPI0016864500|nr:FAD-dependent monooxygenase [Oscillatoria sp. FACHB-1407]MBD2464483.1 FAD-dependent monooxygenase [Oscillatoria sp. FACHB-1407]
MSQIVIVGAGPGGATLALLLAQRGISVTLIEASNTFQRTFRGEGLMPSGLDALHQMGLTAVLQGIPHRPLTAWEFWINGRSLFRVQEPIEPGGEPCTLVSQSALLTALIDQLSHYPHVEFVQGVAVQDLLTSNGRVSGVRLADHRAIAASLVIATDGRNSVARRQANLSLQHQSNAFDILWFRLADSPQFEAENIFYSIVQGQHAFGLFRSSEGNLQVGWALGDRTQDWKQIDWAKTLASASPDWLADHFRTVADSLERPVLLSVVVGRCPQWWVPGLLLLGDAAHPMSPIRAQGINMALRDSIVAANHLVPLMQGVSQAAIPSSEELVCIDQVLPQIQAAREPEIMRAQQLQHQEAAQAELLGNYPLLQWGVSQFAPLIRYPVRYSWVARQRQLRQGVTSVQLAV